MLTDLEASAAIVRAPDVIASVRDLKIHFSGKRGMVHAVDGISFDIRDGETLGLVGETGCGKSVTARSFLRLVQTPPGVYAGGSITFRPRRVCDDCAGAGCRECDDTGRMPAHCPACAGRGCRNCGGSGEETVDLLTIPDAEMRAIRGNRIAMIFQDPGKALNPGLTIRDQIAEVFLQHRTNEILAAAGVSPGNVLLRRQASQKSRLSEKLLLAVPPLRGGRDRVDAVLDAMVAEALAQTQIPNPRKVMERYPHELSGGMRQRVMIAQALACNPDLLIADEPTTALDVTVQARILELIRELQQRHKTAVLYISHDLSLVRRVCDRVMVMYAGRLAETATSPQLFRRPTHPYTRGLLGALPGRGAHRGRLAAIEGTVPELVDPPAACRFAGRCPDEVAVCTRSDPQMVEIEPEHAAACFVHAAAGAGAAAGPPGGRP